jgi:hypothetical protein
MGEPREGDRAADGGDDGGREPGGQRGGRAPEERASVIEYMKML